MQHFNIQFIGTKPYQDAWDLQKKWVQRMSNEKVPHQVILCEHPHVYTFGKSANRENLLISDAKLEEIHAKTFEIERGGDITYHGPGQLVGYPILNLHALNIGVRKYVWALEEALIQTLKHYEIFTKRIDSLTGIWLKDGPDRKIAALGIKVSRGITMHGFALNVHSDLSYFDHIIPCGIADKAVTSMEKELGHTLDVEEVAAQFGLQFKSIFETMN